MTLASQITLEHLQAIDFWGRVDQRSRFGCWEWTRGKNARGYGALSIPARISGLDRPVKVYAHRAAASLHAGELVPSDYVIDHLCRNTACCNPAHLEVVPQVVNVRRSIKRTRPTRRVLKDGTVRWVARFYDNTRGARESQSWTFGTEAEAQALIDEYKAAWLVE